jgi:hypothetical protein
VLVVDGVGGVDLGGTMPREERRESLVEERGRDATLRFDHVLLMGETWLCANHTLMVAPAVGID